MRQVDEPGGGETGGGARRRRDRWMSQVDHLLPLSLSLMVLRYSALAGWGNSRNSLEVEVLSELLFRC